MNDDEVLAQVRDASGAYKAYRLRRFKVWRHIPATRQERELLVTVLDAGPEEGANRYMVEVQNAEDTGEVDPPYSLSNPDDSIANALGGVHWNEFDRRIPE